MTINQLSIAFVLLALLTACSKLTPEQSTQDDSSSGAETSQSQDTHTFASTERSRSAYPDKLLFGDTHNHTGNSFDVYLFGTPTATPETAYRFAKGEPVTNPATGETWQIDRPLDFLVIADHAEMLGAMPLLYDENLTELAETKAGKAFLKLGGTKSEEELLEVYYELQNANDGNENKLGITGLEMAQGLHAGEKRRTAWERNADTAEQFNEPGVFSAVIGWEWTSTTLGANLHRVIFQAEDAEVAKKYLPYSTLESDDPEDLWSWLEETSSKVGATFVAIPHNGNISRGRMFSKVRNNGLPVDADYAATRAKWEPVVEVTQIKGDSETHPVLSPDDEFADFETFSFIMTPGGLIAEPDDSDYVRSALKRGIEYEREFGQNPFKVGMIGSTDTHVGIASIDEANFAGKGQHDSVPSMRAKPTGIGKSIGWDMAAAGYAAAWAHENTREEVVAAFKRREVYATTGPRMALRFFGGFDFADADAQAQNLAQRGYDKGVPMGGELNGEGSKAPNFLVQVMKDANGANLDRVQVIKGWVDAEGKSHERIFDVAVSGDRVIDENGRCMQEVGNTVDMKTGEYTNDIGETAFAVYWEDPAFNPDQDAFYYVRALEIPTPRYSLIDSITLGIPWQDIDHPPTIQERIYSSPIWYHPVK